MQLYVEWSRPIQLRDGTKQNLIYFVDLDKVPDATGVYIFGRRWGTDSRRSTLARERRYVAA